MIQSSEKLSFWQKLGYGVGDIFGGGAFTLIGFFYLVFLTDVIRISPGLAGTVVLISKVYDSITDPFEGVLSDRTRTRWGRRRPYLAAGILLIIAQGAPGGYDPSVSGFAANGYGEHSPGKYNLLSAFLVEVVLTFFLVYTVLGATDIRAPVGFAGIAIGLVLALIHLVGIPVTNTSVNPARSIGPAVFVGGWALSQLWLFIIAPIIGAAIAAGLYTASHKPVEIITAREAQRALPKEQVERKLA